MFYAVTSATAPAPVNAYSLPPAATADVPSVNLGAPGNSFLNVFNSDTSKEGKFEVEVTE